MIVAVSIHAGTLGDVAIQAEQGSLFVYSAGPKAVLAVLSPQGGNAGLIHLEARTTAKEIAEQANVPVGTVKSRLARGLSALGVALRGEGDTDE